MILSNQFKKKKKKHSKFCSTQQTHEHGFHLKCNVKFYLTCKYPENTDRQKQRATKQRF